MPLYRHTCENCGRSVEDFRPMSEMRILPICICGMPMARDIQGETRSGNAAFNKPIELYSLAPETLEQRRELEAVGTTFTPEGVPLARDRAEKKRIMKTAGYVEMS